VILLGLARASELAAQSSSDSLILLGTVKGERYNRLVIRGATVISGRGTPGSNRAMPPEGPVDVVIEGNVIVDLVPADPVNLASRRGTRPTGDRLLDATGMYLIPGLVEMHAHLPRNGGNLGPQALEYTYRIYLGHGVTTVRDAGTGAGIKEMVEQRRLSDANQIVAPRMVLCQRWPLPLGRWNEGHTPETARAVTLPWRETLVHPHELAAGPDSTVHGAHHREWKTSDEVAWKRNFQIWMKWIREFQRRGGLLTAGSDDGELGGISLIRELELMQEAGIHPIDVIKVATTNAYQVLGWERHCGVRVGCIADLAVIDGNPIENLKVMYGMGYGFYGILPREERVKRGGVKWTIKDGVVYDAQALLREAEW
jgi:hypothetical protein